MGGASDRQHAFDLRATGFSAANALVCARLSQAAYTDSPSITGDYTDTQVLVRTEQSLTTTDKIVFVAFRGTTDLRDLLTDADIRKEEFQTIGDRSVKVHRGFHSAAKEVWFKLLNRLLFERDQNGGVMPQIVVTGHSLGGALARIAAIMMHRVDIVPHSIYTFGEPRNGDEPMAQYCDALFGNRHFRCEHDLDAITRMPGYVMGFRHSGQNIFFPSYGGYEINPVLIAKAFSDTWAIFKARHNLGLYAIAELLGDHHIDNYIRLLEALQS